MINNPDETVSFEDETDYTQEGSEFGAGQVNQTNGAINNIYNERILDLDELELVTEPGFFVDALAVKELNSNKLELLGYVDVSVSAGGLAPDVGKQIKLTYDVPEGTKQVIPIYVSCSYGSVYGYDFSNALNGSFNVSVMNLSSVNHTVIASYRVLFLG